MRRIADQRGQATVELVALLPSLAVLLAALWQAALAGQAVWAVTAAARAAARADAVGGERARRRARPPPALARARSARADTRGRRGAGQRPHPGASRPAEPRPRARRRPLRAAVMSAARPARRPSSSSPSSRCSCSSRWPPPRCSPATERGEQAGQAAQAGAMAMLQGGDPRESARRALPAGVRRRAAVEIHGRRVTVRVRPPPAHRGPRDDRRGDRRRRPEACAMSGVVARGVTAGAGPEPAP